MGTGLFQSHFMRVGTLAAAACLACTTLGGCLMMANSHTSVRGTPASEQTLSQVEVGKTTKAWLIASLGKPSAETQVDEHTQILRYDWKQSKKDTVAVLILFAADNCTETRHSAYFELTDGVVQRHWQETEAAEKS